MSRGRILIHQRGKVQIGLELAHEGHLFAVERLLTVRLHILAYLRAWG